MSAQCASERSIAAVIVAFAPDESRFEAVLSAALLQADRVWIVDNAQGSGLSRVVWSDRLTRIDMLGNAGVAAAQNAGMTAAFAAGATHALLLDHDSVVSEGLLDSLYAAWFELQSKGEQVAAVGADYRDARRPDVSPFIRLDGWRLARPIPGDSTIAAVSYLISSGSLISAQAFAAVGLMDERLFVDYVDIEWGLRAAQVGWRSFGVFHAMLDHLLGDDQLRIFGTSYPMRSPMRHYYMVRNAIWLILRGSVPFNWKVAEGTRLVRRSIAYALFAPRSHLHVASMLAGLRDALKGRLGERLSPR